MSKMFKWGKEKLLKWIVIISIPIIAILVIISMMFYIQIWYQNQQVLVINIQNASSYLALIIGILLSSLINLGFVVYYIKSLKRVERMCSENMKLSELIIKHNISVKDEIINEIKNVKVGAKID